MDEIFETFNPKPQPTPQQQQPQQQQQLPPTGIQQPAHQYPNPTPAGFNGNMPMQPAGDPYGQIPTGPRGGGFGPDNHSRKRSFHDHAGEEQDSHYNRGDRSFKNPRVRRGGSMGRGDRMGGRDGRPQGPPFPQAPTAPQQGGFPGMPPQPPPGFPPFDPNDPMAAMLAIQNMFPQMPGMPPMPQVPTSSGSPGQQQPTQAGSPPAGIAQRCKDYDTQGFCILGSTCPYQHGSNHVVAAEDDGKIDSTIFFFPYDAERALIKVAEYDPTNAKIIDTKATNGTNGQRSPFRGGGRERGRGRGRGGRGDFGSQRRNRAEFSLTGPNEDKSITTIVVEQIPEDKFNEQSIREFFSEFGEIVEVTLQPYRQLALVKYDSYPAAKRAWSSPKVIFDNRFVKVYWYKPNGKNDQQGGRPSAPAESRPEEPPFDMEEFEKQQADAQKAYEEKMQKRKEAEEAREALEKQREELLKKQQEEKEKLMQRLAEKEGARNGSSTPSKREGSQENGTPAESDNASEQTKALRAQLAALEAEAKSLGIDPENNGDPSYRGHGRGRGGYRGRGSFPPRGRGGYDPSYRGGYRGRGAPRGRGGVLRLDNRPKRVAISGVQFDTARDEALRQFLVVSCHDPCIFFYNFFYTFH